jgi:1-deoxy-D-xylulose-5-phosphate reductoisomerase
MRTPIAHTLAWPDRMGTPCEPLDLARIGRLDFEEPDFDRFPALRLALDALAAGGARPGVLNAANEEAVAAFLAGRIGFLDIAATVDQVLSRYAPDAPQTIEEALAIDAETRRVAAHALERQAA